MAFMILERLFEPIVMFFKLTNSLTTFQIMINKILQDLINTRKVVSFIENMIVRIEKKEKYNKIIEKQ